MDEREQPDEMLDGIADLLGEAVDDAREGGRWVRANLREMMGALGIRDVDGSEPHDV